MIVTTVVGEFTTGRHADPDRVLIRARSVDELEQLRVVLNIVLEMDGAELRTQYPVERFTVDGRPELEMTRSAWALTLGVLAEEAP